MLLKNIQILALLLIPLAQTIQGKVQQQKIEYPGLISLEFTKDNAYLHPETIDSTKKVVQDLKKFHNIFPIDSSLPINTWIIVDISNRGVSQALLAITQETQDWNQNTIKDLVVPADANTLKFYSDPDKDSIDLEGFQKDEDVLIVKKTNEGKAFLSLFQNEPIGEISASEINITTKKYVKGECPYDCGEKGKCENEKCLCVDANGSLMGKYCTKKLQSSAETHQYYDVMIQPYKQIYIKNEITLGMPANGKTQSSLSSGLGTAFDKKNFSYYIFINPKTKVSGAIYLVSNGVNDYDFESAPFSKDNCKKDKQPIANYASNKKPKGKDEYSKVHMIHTCNNIYTDLKLKHHAKYNMKFKANIMYLTMYNHSNEAFGASVEIINNMSLKDYNFSMLDVLLGIILVIVFTSIIQTQINTLYTIICERFGFVQYEDGYGTRRGVKGRTKLKEGDWDLFFKPFEYKNLSKLNKFNQQSCSICMDSYNNEEMLRQVPKCEHIFHDECLIEWLKTKQQCPNCNLELTRDKLLEYYDEAALKTKGLEDQPRYSMDRLVCQTTNQPMLLTGNSVISDQVSYVLESEVKKDGEIEVENEKD